MRVTNGVLNLRHWPFAPFDAGWSSPVARQAHNLKAAGSNPAPATKSSPPDLSFGSRLAGFFVFCSSLLTLLHPEPAAMLKNPAGAADASSNTAAVSAPP